MKSINQIFKSNPSLKEEREVVELIEYCQELESEVFDNRQNSSHVIEQKLKAFTSEIFSSLEETLDENNKEEVDYEKSLKNLLEYFKDFQKDNYYSFKYSQ